MRMLNSTLSSTQCSHESVLSLRVVHDCTPQDLFSSAPPLSCHVKSETRKECLSADPDLLKQLFTRSFMKFHDRPDLQMRLAEGDEITTEGMLAAKCAHLQLIVVTCLHLTDLVTCLHLTDLLTMISVFFPPSKRHTASMLHA